MSAGKEVERRIEMKEDTKGEKMTENWVGMRAGRREGRRGGSALEKMHSLCVREQSESEREGASQ